MCCLRLSELLFTSQFYPSNLLSFVLQEGELDAVAVVHSYEPDMPAGSHKTRLTALNVRLLL